MIKTSNLFYPQRLIFTCNTHDDKLRTEDERIYEELDVFQNLQHCERMTCYLYSVSREGEKLLKISFSARNSIIQTLDSGSQLTRYFTFLYYLRPA